MFNFFKKKDQEIKVIDKVAMSESAKWEAMLTKWNGEKNTAFIFWFDESLRQATSFFAGETIEPVCLLSTKEAGSSQLADKKAVFAEHYPMRSKEEELYNKMNLKSVQVYSSLNEPLFQRFGAQKIIRVMQQLGMKDNEVIEHKMVSKAIRNMQDKIEKKIVVDHLASSQTDWLQKNYIS